MTKKEMKLRMLADTIRETEQKKNNIVNHMLALNLFGDFECMKEAEDLTCKADILFNKLANLLDKKYSIPELRSIVLI